MHTFGRVAGLVLAPVAEDFVFNPGHVLGVGFVVLLLGPLRHRCGMLLLRMRGKCSGDCGSREDNGISTAFKRWCRWIVHKANKEEEENVTITREASSRK